MLARLQWGVAFVVHHAFPRAAEARVVAVSAARRRAPSIAWRRSNVPRSTIPHLLVAVCLILVGALPGQVLAQSDASLFEVYRSPEFGYLLWWGPDEWTVEDQSSERGADWIRLSHEDTTVDLWGFAAPGVSAESCLREGLDLLANDPGVTRFEDLHNPGAAPEILASDDGQTATTDVVLAFDTDAGRATVAARESCVAIEPGESLLYRSEWITAEAYNARSGNFSDAVRAFLSRMTMPRTHWSFHPGTTHPFVPVRPDVEITNVTRLLSPDGAELGLLSLHDTCMDFLASGPMVIVENSGFADLEISPDGFFIVTVDGLELAPSSARWLSPPGDAASIVLERGEVAILALSYETESFYTHYFLDPVAGPVELGSPHWGCGGGGGAPIVIDME